ncbi:hypothetical protein CO641_00495 [Lysobacteraceae bacterium NML91-0213]|nr:hypothetical protein CO641_00495 [Xanthomonadaceae bacterium NML91-0213]
MDAEKNRQRVYWNGLADLAPETSVIDPRDSRGDKNAYIAGIRDEVLTSALAGKVDQSGLILDFGCGTGSATLALLQHGYRVIGVDLALSLLKHARQRCDPERSLFAAMDGHILPVAKGAFDAAVIYVVLSYVVSDDKVLALLKAIRSALKPGARIVAIEQCRRRRHIVEDGMKVHRTIGAWTELMAAAGFSELKARPIRSGRFPATSLIRIGLIPRSAWQSLRTAERASGRIFGILPGDYAEVAFEGVA